MQLAVCRGRPAKFPSRSRPRGTISSARSLRGMVKWRSVGGPGDSARLARSDRTMDLPRYCIVGARPVKAIETEDGGMDILAYDWSTGEFARHMEFLTRVCLPDEEVEVVSQEQFDAQVAELRARLK